MPSILCILTHLETNLSWQGLACLLFDRWGNKAKRLVTHPRSQSKLGRAEIQTQAWFQALLFPSSPGTRRADLLWSLSGPSSDFITPL